MNKENIEGLDKLLLAIDPRTQRPRLFVPAGMSEEAFGQPKVPLYAAFEGVSGKYRLDQLKDSSFAHDVPVKVYTLAETIRYESQQTRLF